MARGVSGIDASAFELPAGMAQDFPVEARGGIGNCVNAAWAAQVTGRPLRWRATGDLRPEDLFVDTAALGLTDAPGQVVSLFPNIDPERLGTPGHHPQHDGATAEELMSAEWHWSSPILRGDLPSRLQLRSGGQSLPAGTIGVHVRTDHPYLDCDVDAATAAVNALTEQSSVFLATDAQLPGLSSVVIRSAMPRPAHDDDRGRPAIESALHDWFTLGRCAAIHRLHASSTFVDYWCFVAGVPIRKLLGHETCAM